MAKADDRAIMSYARANREVILTHDLDYGNLLAFSGDPTPSVVIIRIRNTHPENILARITHAWSQIEKPLTEGAIVTIEDAACRVRRLPITQEE